MNQLKTKSRIDILSMTRFTLELRFMLFLAKHRKQNMVGNVKNRVSVNTKFTQEKAKKSHM